MDIFHRKSSKRGQAAIEFLMTYGWMLLIVLIVGALIFSFVDFGSLLPNTVDLNNNFRAEPTQSQARADDNILITFQYNGNDRVVITGSGGNSVIDNIEGAASSANCSVSWVKNVDTDISSASTISPGFGIAAGAGTATPQVVFLRSQLGLIEFNCGGNPDLLDNDVLTGEIKIEAVSSRTGVPIRSEGNLRLGISS